MFSVTQTASIPITCRRGDIRVEIQEVSAPDGGDLHVGKPGGILLKSTSCRSFHIILYAIHDMAIVFIHKQTIIISRVLLRIHYSKPFCIGSKERLKKIIKKPIIYYRVY